MSASGFYFYFGTSSGWISAIIRWFSRSGYLSHMAGRFTGLTPLVLSAEGEGVELFTEAKYFKLNNVNAIVQPVSGPLADWAGCAKLMAWAIEEFLGQGYDYLAAGAVGAENRINDSIAEWLAAHESKERVHCTELWVKVLQKAEYACVADFAPATTDTRELLQALARSAEFNIEWIHPGLAKEIGIG